MANLDRLAAVYEDALTTRLGISTRRADPPILIDHDPLTFGLTLGAADPEYLPVLPVRPPDIDPTTLREICLRTTRQQKVVKDRPRRRQRLLLHDRDADRGARPAARPRAPGPGPADGLPHDPCCSFHGPDGDPFENVVAEP